jgi:hypothetical protein
MSSDEEEFDDDTSDSTDFDDLETTGSAISILFWEI